MSKEIVENFKAYTIWKSLPAVQPAEMQYDVIMLPLKIGLPITFLEAFVVGFRRKKPMKFTKSGFYLDSLRYLVTPTCGPHFFFSSEAIESSFPSPQNEVETPRNSWRDSEPTCNVKRILLCETPYAAKPQRLIFLKHTDFPWGAREIHQK